MKKLLFCLAFLVINFVSFAQPANDNFASATDVSLLINSCSPNAAYTTINATADQSKGSCWSNGPNYNVWFKFTATTPYIKAQVKVGGAEGTMQNAMVALWNSSLTQLNCQDYQGASTDIETDYYGLTVGQTYYISVDNYVGSGYRGTFTLCLSDVVDYNFFEGATDVTTLINGCSANAAYTTINATADRSKGSCWSNGPNYNRWFKFTATTPYIKAQVKVGGAEGTMQNAMVALWNSSLTQLNCQDYQGASTDIETDYYGLTVGQTYYISVDNYVGSGYRGSFTLCLSDVLDYNFYEGAVSITDLNNWCSANAEYSTVNATADKNKGSCWSNGPNYNRWFKFKAVTNTVTVQVKVGGAEGTLQNPFVALWQANGTTQAACTNFAGASVDISLTYNTLTIGNTYYISVDNYAGSGYRGTFTLCVNSVNSTAFYSRANGSWHDVNTWSNVGYGGVATSSLPAAGNVVNIRDNTVTISAAAQCAEINMTTSTANTSLTVDNATLQVNGKMVVTNSANNSVITTVQNNGQLSIANNFSMTRSGGNSTMQLLIPTGGVATGQDFLANSSAGTVSTNDVVVGNASSLSVGRDLALTYSGGMKVGFTFNNTASLSVGRDLTFTASAAGGTELVFNSSAGMSIKRNIVRGSPAYGMLTFNNSSTLTFNGTANQQTIPASAGAGGDAITYNHVTMNNTSGFPLDFSLGGIAAIPGTLTLQNGIIQSTGSNYISLLAGSNNSIGSLSSYVDGPIAISVATSTPSTVVSLPLGKSGSYRPAVLNVTHSDNVNVTYTAEHFSASAAALGYTLPGTIDKVSGTRYWTINRSAVANLTSATVTLYYGIGTGDGVTDPPNLRVVKTNGAGTVWFDAGGTGSAVGTGTITSSPFTTFSTITLGNALAGGNPLPIELSYFDARVNGDRVELEWITESELNNDYFSVERSNNGFEFHEIGRVSGKGTTKTETHYNLFDELPFGKIYYRLRQFDFDGNSTVSRIVSVETDSNSISNWVSVYPNPVSTKSFHVEVSAVKQGDFVTFRLTDVTGKKVLDARHITGDGVYKSEIPCDAMPTGMYILTVTHKSRKSYQRIVIQR